MGLFCAAAGIFVNFLLATLRPLLNKAIQPYNDINKLAWSCVKLAIESCIQVAFCLFIAIMVIFVGCDGN